MITERTLRKWRKEALKVRRGADIKEKVPTSINCAREYVVQTNERILRLTQELLDQHLLRK